MISHGSLGKRKKKSKPKRHGGMSSHKKLMEKNNVWWEDWKIHRRQNWKYEHDHWERVQPSRSWSTGQLFVHNGYTGPTTSFTITSSLFNLRNYSHLSLYYLRFWSILFFIPFFPSTFSNRFILLSESHKLGSQTNKKTQDIKRTSAAAVNATIQRCELK